MDKTFKSNIDKAYYIRSFLLVVFVVSLFFVFRNMAKPEIFKVVTYLALMVIFLGGLFIPPGTGYKITQDGLFVINYGFRKTVINIKDIKSVRVHRSLYEFIYTSHVNSMDQLMISYGRNSTINISPRGKDDFIKSLLVQNPGIQIS
jgi:hypothetical protein